MNRILQSAREALAIAKGEMDPKRGETEMQVQHVLGEPNAETISAMEEGRNPAALKRYATTGELWADMSE